MLTTQSAKTPVCPSDAEKVFDIIGGLECESVQSVASDGVQSISLILPGIINMIEKANYDDYCVWNNCTSDSKPSRKRFDSLTVSELQGVKTFADRARGIQAEYDEQQKRIKKRIENMG